MDRWAGRVAADAAGRHATSSPFPKDDVADLTDREREIAVLVGRRLSNKEIAARLYISVRTVESHVYTARGKLGAESRRELGSIVGL
ncbi:LuxR family transcriptional regulator [Agromyces atrinae]|uniref:LuxR family transcriptional regulator n=1 Tax=Agromyces atrinae TaxID=592376 RepID=A0A4Q2M2V0_9MICO|nr:LuxR family transcriptional regulator [Agromyces atrinae]